MANEKHSLNVNESQAGRVDHLVRDVTELARSKVTRLFENKCVRVNGKICRESHFRVAEGDVVQIQYDPKAGYPEIRKPWEDRTFEVVFEDSWIIVVNKTAGVLTVPTEKSNSNTLLDRLKLYVNHSRRGRECFVVHRLDRQVSGLLVFAKTTIGAELLQTQFTEMVPKRMFTGIVNGIVEKPEGVFESHLATAKNLDQFSVYGKEKETGKHAVTNYKVIGTKLDTTIVEVELRTSRRHQLRVHFADAGHPVIGDPRYGKKKSNHRNWTKRRMALHSHRLEFYHPESGEPISFQSPVPTSIKKFRPMPIDE
ncbi:MAG: RluA family pseudouridine synthase [Mariniblastus sp.]